MNNTLIGCLVSIGSFFSFLVAGYALISILKVRSTGLIRFCYAIAIGIVVHGLSGICILQFEDTQFAAKVFFTLVVLLGVASFIRCYQKRQGIFLVRISRLNLSLFILWVTFIIGCNTLIHLKINFPSPLFDGPYVVKKQVLPVKVQALSLDLPADNLIPYLVSEYLLRDISFKKERPIMPGQEVTNRTILMSLVAIPFRALTQDIPKWSGSLGTFQYVGRDWPDIQKLINEYAYTVFVAVGITLNGLIYFSFLLLYRFFIGNRFVFLGSLLFLTTPYVFLQTVFVWPKSLAAFFILIGLYRVILSKEKIWITFALFGLAYHSHPFSIAFAGGCFLYYLIHDIRVKNIKNTVVAFLTLCVFLFPWFIWTKIILNISSDLVLQNFIAESIPDFFWTRFFNLYRLIFPFFLGIYPFDAKLIFREMNVSLAGVLGLILIVFSYGILYQYLKDKKYRLWVICSLLVPTLFITLVFSRPNTPILHGCQVIIPILIIFAFRKLISFPKKVVLLIICSQILINGALYTEHLKKLGIAFSNNDVKINLLEWSNKKIESALYPVHVNIPVVIGGLERKCVWMNPPAILTYHGIQVDKEDTLCFEYTFHPEVIGLPQHDGANFNVRIMHKNKLKKEWVFYSEAKGNIKSQRIVLSDLAGKEVDITFSISNKFGGRTDGDWCLWINPRIEKK